MMKLNILTLAGLIATGLAAMAAPEIEVEVQFIETSEVLDAEGHVAWQLTEAQTQSLVAGEATNFLAFLERSGNIDVLSAPKVRTQSGTNATVKVVRECRYATGVEVLQTAVTNGDDIVHGVAVVPGHFETRDVGITLHVTPVYDEQRNTIDLELSAEVVSEPTWMDYTAEYMGADGSRHTVLIPQPSFQTRHIAPRLSIRNNTTVVMGGLTTEEKRLVEDRVPILGAIPGIGRLFRSTHEVNDKRHLFISINARIVSDTE